MVEMTDMREAQRSYEANINVISATRRMLQRTLDILKSEQTGLIHHGHADRRRQRLCQYRAPCRSLAGARRLPTAGRWAGDTSFASMLKDALGAVKDAGHKSDAQTRAAVNGKANMVDVVTAVSETEVAIDAVVAVRDKVIAAYEEIMKMPI